MKVGSKMLSMTIAISLIAVMICGLFNPADVQAATMPTIDLTQLTADTSGDGWSYVSSTGVLTITSGEIKVTTGGAIVTDKVIEISGDRSVCPEINLRIESLYLNTRKSCIKVVSSNTSDIRITLYRDNSLVSTGSAGILKYDGTNSTMTIDGSGRVTATGATNYPGIGSDSTFANFVVNSGTIIANGGSKGAGIGGYNVSNITINGGTIVATGGNEGAGIGGNTNKRTYSGNTTNITNITINGGNITAIGGTNASGIGAGRLDDYYSGGWRYYTMCYVKNITINAGTIYAEAGNSNTYCAGGAGIGGGTVSNIVINGGNVTAKIFDYSSLSNIPIPGYAIGAHGKCSASNITINGGIIDVSGSVYQSGSYGATSVSNPIGGSTTSGVNSINGGTITIHGKQDLSSFVVMGGTFNVDGTISSNPRNVSNETLSLYTFTGFEPNMNLNSPYLYMDYYDYSLNSVRADSQGNINVFLPSGLNADISEVIYNDSTDVLGSQLVLTGSTVYYPPFDDSELGIIAWCTDEGLIQEFEFGETIITQDITLYAKYDCSVHGHVYDNDCDDTCNACGETRTVNHEYDNDCDDTCNVCGEVRITEHTYDNDCDDTCNVCEAVREVADHEYTDDCDVDCNICGEERVAPHTPEPIDAVDATCTEAGLTEGSICAVCGEILVEQEEVSATGHTPVIDSEVPATTETTGLTEGSHCDVCGEILVAQEEIPVIVIPAKNGWVKENNIWYYYTDDVAATGWKKIDNKWYYFGEDGAMKTGWQQISGKWYYLESSGAMATGWRQMNGKWYYLESSGVMASGWKKIDNKWYYFVSSGAMATGWQKVDNSWYYFESSGAMVSGWKQISGTWYYFGSSGTMATGWQEINGTWYYFQSSGAMVTGTQTINGRTYNFTSSGAWIK